MTARSGDTETDLDEALLARLEARRARASVPRFELAVVEGVDRNARWTSAGTRAGIGSHASNDFVLADRMVSRFHCEIEVAGDGFRLRDLGSTNGTWVDGLRIAEVWLRPGHVLQLGQTVLRLEASEERNHLRLASRSEMGRLAGGSTPMRIVFALLERAAAADITVLLQGETGTGKGLAAEAIHEASARRHGPFVVVDCGAIPRQLVASELFGHERGAFTGADRQRAGAFEAASGGTIFLDEIGELPLDLQPALLRVIESRVITRVGGRDEIPADVRVIAATNRDLRAEVNESRFREDLYYRLAVFPIEMPSLRSRPGDVPLIAERILRGLGVERPETVLTSEMLARLASHAWPGNARQLRNYLERCVVLETVAELDGRAHALGGAGPLEGVDLRVPFAEARQRLLERFERTYLAALLSDTEGNVSEAARRSDMNRTYLHKLLAKYGLR